MRWAWPLLVTAAVVGCAGEFERRAEKLSGGDCDEEIDCENLVFVDCGGDVDGPTYYFNRDTGDLISTCGGACLLPQGDQVEVCRTLCPPPAWTCPRS